MPARIWVSALTALKRSNVLRGPYLSREPKIVASVSREEIIIVSSEKFVNQLGNFPLPVEVIPFGWQVIFNFS